MGRTAAINGGVLGAEGPVGVSCGQPRVVWRLVRVGVQAGGGGWALERGGCSGESG